MGVGVGIALRLLSFDMPFSSEIFLVRPGNFCLLSGREHKSVMNYRASLEMVLQEK